MMKEKYRIEKLTVGRLRTNCYLIIGELAKECIIIDPGDCASEILKFMEERNLKCQAVFITHGHPDHVGGLRKILEVTDAVLYVNSIDSACSSEWGPRPFLLPEEYRNVSEDMEIRAGNFILRSIPCPGHSPGGMSYVWEDNIFTGDTLFKGTCGRCDIPHADQGKLVESVEKLLSLPEHYKVYPGHGKATDIGTEKRNRQTVL